MPLPAVKVGNLFGTGEHFPECGIKAARHQLYTPGRTYGSRFSGIDSDTLELVINPNSRLSKHME